MNEQFKKYFEAIVTFWKNMSRKSKTITLSVIGGVVVFAVVLELIMSLPSYSVLYSGLSDKEAQEVVAYLDKSNTTYKEKSGTIYVLSKNENTIRMELANQGYPTSTLNYDFFTENVNAMTTDDEKKVIEKYQLNQRLEAVIKTFDAINNATVTINIPDTNTYAWDTSSSKASASVTVTMNSGKTLSKTQVNGIKQLVAKSVPNLSTDDVAVIDTATGEELSASSSNGTAVDISEFKMAIEKEYENTIVNNVKSILSPVFGEGNIKVTAKSTMDVDSKVKNIITYLPSSSSSNTGVVTKSTEDKEQQKNADSSGSTTAGTDSNSESTTTYSGVTTDGNTIYVKDQNSYEYLVSQVTEQIQSDAASVSNLTISVAINQAAMDSSQKTEVGKLVANAAGVDTAKVTIYNAAFASTTSTTNATNKQSVFTAALGFNNLMALAGIGVIGVLFILTVVFMMISGSRKKKLKSLLNSQNEEESGTKAGKEAKMNKSKAEQPVVPEDDEMARQRKELEALHAAQQTKAQELRKDLQDFSSQNPEIVAQLVRSWMRGDENDG